MSTKTAERPSARERLLAAADELFYEEGVHTVGIDRVIERAGVAKASLYNSFGSKDELVRTYLANRQIARKERITTKLTRYDTARERLVGLFDLLGELISEPGFRGCAFANASAESAPGSTVISVCDASRAWTRTLFTDLAREAGATDPEHLAVQLVLLYDGAMVSARMDRNPAAALNARGVAEILVSAAVGGGRS